MRRTLSLKLVDPPQDELRRTMSVFRDTCEILSTLIQQGSPINRGRLHKHFYKFLRKKFNLPSQMAQSEIRVVIGAYRAGRAIGDKGSIPTSSVHKSSISITETGPLAMGKSAFEL